MKNGTGSRKTTPKYQQRHKGFGDPRALGQPETPSIGHFSEPQIDYGSSGTHLIVPPLSQASIPVVISSFNDPALAVERLGRSLS